MANDAAAQQIIITLVNQAVTRLAAGTPKSEVVAELVMSGVAPDVAEAIATRGEEFLATSAPAASLGEVAVEPVDVAVTAAPDGGSWSLKKMIGSVLR